MTAITLPTPSHSHRLTVAVCALAVTMFAAGALSHASIAPATPERTDPVVARVAGTLPVEYYVTDDEAHASQVRALFETVNRTRQANGEPMIRVAVVDPVMDLSTFLRIVGPEDKGAGVIIRDIRNSCGVCATDEPEW